MNRHKLLALLTSLLILLASMLACVPPTVKNGIQSESVVVSDAIAGFDSEETNKPSTEVLKLPGEEETAKPALETLKASGEEDVALGTIRGKVLMDNGTMLPCGIVVIDENGHSYLDFTEMLGSYNLTLAPGIYTLRFTRGPEYSVVERTVTVESSRLFYEQDVRLVQLYDSYEKGWYSGDLHQHSYYSDGAQGAEFLLNANIAAGLDFAFLSDHNTARGLPAWSQGNYLTAHLNDDGSQRLFKAYEAVEVTSEFGHYNSLGVGWTPEAYDMLLYEYERAQTDEVKEAIINDRLIYIAKTIQKMGGVAQINHPYSANVLGFTNWDVVEYFDVFEIWNGMFLPCDGRYESEKTSSQKQNYRSKLHWFELLNKIKDGGKYLPATCGTDNHDPAGPYNDDPIEEPISTIDEYHQLFKQTGKYCGVPRTYLNIRGESNLENTLKAIREGHSFMTNGIVVLCDINGATYGDTSTLTSESIMINTDIWCRDGLTGLRVIKNGETVSEIELDGQTTYSKPIELTGVISTDWIVIEVFGPGTLYAITNPIFFN